MFIKQKRFESFKLHLKSLLTVGKLSTSYITSYRKLPDFNLLLNWSWLPNTPQTTFIKIYICLQCFSVPSAASLSSQSAFYLPQIMCLHIQRSILSLQSSEAAVCKSSTSMQFPTLIPKVAEHYKMMLRIYCRKIIGKHKEKHFPSHVRRSGATWKLKTVRERKAICPLEAGN